MGIATRKTFGDPFGKEIDKDVSRRPKLRSIDREHIHCLNQINLHREPIAFEWLSKSWQMTLRPISSPELVFSERALVDWGGAEVVLRLECSLVDAVITSLLGSESLGALEGEIRNLVIDGAFSGLSETIEAGFRKRFRLVQTNLENESVIIHPPRSKRNHALHGFSFALSDGVTNFFCEAWIDNLALVFLADAVRFWQSHGQDGPSWDGLSIPIMLTVGWTTLPLGAIRHLSLNDVILLDECFIGEDLQNIFIRFGDRFGVKAELHNSSITFVDSLEGIMEDIDELDDSGEDFSQTDVVNEAIDQIPVRLCFDLGERVMTLRELKALGPGYVIELGRELRRAVAIRVNGRKNW